MRVVIDCNILVACLSTRSPYHNIYKSLVSGKFELIVSQDILFEYEEIVQIKYGTNTAEAFMSLLALLQNVHIVHPFYKWNLISADPDDDKYCDCAVSGAADYIVTEDSHFNILSTIPFPQVTVVNIAAFSSMV
jgi:uncharacterized protein